MPRFPLVSILVLWLLCSGLSLQLDPTQYAGGRSRNEQNRAQVNQSALATVLGEFRTSMSDMILIKTERLLHGGVAYMPHATRKVQGSGESEASAPHDEESCEDPEHDHHEVESCEDPEHDHHEVESCEDSEHDHDHEHGPGCGHGNEHANGHREGCDHEGPVETVIPEESKDYRGWIGQLHREVKPWRPPEEKHHLAEGAELIPWFRMITLSDPHYIRGYTLGVMWLEEEDPAAAMDYVNEGLEHNPDAFQLHLAKAFLYLHAAGKAAELSSEHLETQQLAVLRKALASFEQAAVYMEKKRPAGWSADEAGEALTWSYSHETDAMSAVRMAVILNERCGNVERAIQLAGHYLNLMPHHATLQRFIQEPH